MREGAKRRELVAAAVGLAVIAGVGFAANQIFPAGEVTLKPDVCATVDWKANCWEGVFRDCDEFGSQEDAQRFYEMVRRIDPERAEGFQLTNDEGIACERLPVEGG